VFTERKATLDRRNARPDNVDKVRSFIPSDLRLAGPEDLPVSWYALQIYDSTSCIFDTADDGDGRQEHLDGENATALIEW